MADRQGLLPLVGCDNAARLADVVFVHGLDGDARSTWHPRGNPEAFWPAWLGEALPGLGIWSLGYAVSASAWKGHAMPLYDRAENTLDVLELDGIGRRPVAFICHSLGGLLIKQVLRTARDAHNAAWQDIARHTRLIVFLSTPHSGASLASWMQYVSTLLRTTVSVEELEAHHPRLRELNNWYRDQHTALGLTTFVYYEKRPTVAGILVVDATTADPGIPGVRPIPLDEDHVSICKPASRQEQVYRRVQRLLEEMLTTLQGVTPPAAHPLGSPYTGESKLSICRRLSRDWQDLADYFEIPPSERDRFQHGREPQGVWEWVEDRARLEELAEALVYIGRSDLVELLPPRPQEARRGYQARHR